MGSWAQTLSLLSLFFTPSSITYLIIHSTDIYLHLLSVGCNEDRAQNESRKNGHYHDAYDVAGGNKTNKIYIICQTIINAKKKNSLGKGDWDDKRNFYLGRFIKTLYGFPDRVMFEQK